MFLLIYPFSWVQRYRWEDTGWKGGDEGYPRFLYTMNGERKEYDVVSQAQLEFYADVYTGEEERGQELN